MIPINDLIKIIVLVDITSVNSKTPQQLERAADIFERYVRQHLSRREYLKRYRAVKNEIKTLNQVELDEFINGIRSMVQT